MVADALPAPSPPGYGQPCNGCGRCCLKEPCDVALEVLDLDFTRGPCPALVHDGTVYRCGLNLHPERFGAKPEWPPERIARELQFGVQCDRDVVDHEGRPA